MERSASTTSHSANSHPRSFQSLDSVTRSARLDASATATWHVAAPHTSRFRSISPSDPSHPPNGGSPCSLRLQADAAGDPTRGDVDLHAFSISLGTMSVSASANARALRTTPQLLALTLRSHSLTLEQIRDTRARELAPARHSTRRTA